MKFIFNAIGNYLKTTDKLLFVLVILISTFSVVSLAGISTSGFATDTQVAVQAIAAALGITGAIIMSTIDYKFMAKLWKLHSFGAYLLVLLTFVIGIQVGDVVDDRAWLPMPFGLTLQPSEILKASYIVTFALHLQKVGPTINRIRSLIPILAHAGVTILLIVAQGDDGTAIIFTMITACMLFAAGISWKYIVAAVTGAVVLAPLAWNFLLSEYQKLRILTVFYPDLDPQGISWQQSQGLMALGSGQLWGKGIFREDHHYIPMMYNDFIYTFIGEAMGFMGCITIVALLMTLFMKILFTGLFAKDLLGKYICVGVFAMFVSQTILNLGMCLGLLPVIGITLPFVSAGGTSVVVSYMGIGLALSVYMHSERNFFSNNKL